MSTIEKKEECTEKINGEEESNKSNSDEYENIRLEEHNLKALLIFTEI